MTAGKQTTNVQDRGRRNWRFLVGLVGVVAVMVGLSFAAVPAYRAFCQKFGFAGTPLRAENGDVVPVTQIDRKVVVRFNSDTDPGLPWHFQPKQRTIALKVGETGLAFYEATNRSTESITGTATFNVSPAKAAPYFVKIECFCFTEQTLQPGESVDMPVTFYVDPAIVEDRNLDEVGQITLSYTFYRDKRADTANDKTAALPRAASSVN
jgi:cytochrome c oxidase assembly protein subunit 11